MGKTMHKTMTAAPAYAGVPPPVIDFADVAEKHHHGAKRVRRSTVANAGRTLASGRYVLGEIRR
jgi:hypothetical protein